MTGRMYYFFSLLLAFVLLLLTVGGETGRGRSCPHVFFYTNLALSGAGAVLVLGTLIAARQTIFGSGFDAEFAGWAWDMLGVYYRLSLIPLAVFLGVISRLITALAMEKFWYMPVSRCSTASRSLPFSLASSRNSFISSSRLSFISL